MMIQIALGLFTWFAAAAVAALALGRVVGDADRREKHARTDAASSRSDRAEPAATPCPA